MAHPFETARREFLAAAAGVLAGAVATAKASEDDKQPIRTAVIGTGARGCDLLRALTTIEGCDVVGACDDYSPHLERGIKYAGPAAIGYSDYRQLLDKLKPQAVVIAVPLAKHFEIAAACLAAGCAVFVEKTMCFTLDESRRLAKQVEAGKHVFQVGLQRRANLVYQQAFAMIQAGLLGQITAVKAQWHRNNNWRRPVPLPKNDPGWQAQEKRLNWRLYKETSAGLMAELGSHQMDAVNWLLGGVPSRVVASGGIDYWRDGRDVKDNVFCLFDYVLKPKAAAGEEAKPYTVRVTYSSLCNNAYEGASELFLGTKGSLYLTSNKGLFYREAVAEEVAWSRRSLTADAGEENAAVLAAGKTLKLSNSPWAHRGEPIELDPLQGDDTRDELVSFLKHVRQGDVKTICNAREGLRDAAVVCMANEAIDTGAPAVYPANAG